ncbi:MAG TPA: chloride channel protein [Tepidisphaeraceae bacterium]|jgi:H+/Cl- antiporter ClcA|nr:chloride channel protein [Tepidisphaeraceae bacterium]
MSGVNHPEYHVQKASTTDALPMAPSLGPALQAAQVPFHTSLVDRRVLYISLLSALLGIISAFVAKALVLLIGLITGVCFFGHWKPVLTAPVGSPLGWWIVLIPVAGGIVVGLMARYGSTGIRGHGIPEAMESVLLNQSRVPARLTFLKPLSAAIAIGTGGPFGAEGPIIATGGAVGSLMGQLLSTTAIERKTLLAAGAAAGMAAIFGTPVAAVLLVVELLLFEFRPRSFIPVAIASTVAAAARFAVHLPYPIFQMPKLTQPSLGAMAVYLIIGSIVGFASVWVTRAVYAVEDLFAELPIHWMWWPAIGAIPVGVIGYFQPRTLGVGYENITDILFSHMALWTVVSLCALKFISWCIALGSGTSGGTLAPLFTIGGGVGFALGRACIHVFPAAGVDISIAALIGMAAMFGGASRTLLASAVFAYETTLQPACLLPLLGGCTTAYFVSCLLMRNTIMTEKIARRGVEVPSEYISDMLAFLKISQIAARKLITIPAEDTIESIRQRLAAREPGFTHQGYPIIDPAGAVVGVLTLRDLHDPHATNGHVYVRELIRRSPITIFPDASLRDAANEMIRNDVGRLVVVERGDSRKAIGIVTRSDLLRAQRSGLDDMILAEPDIPWRRGRNKTRMPD